MAFTVQNILDEALRLIHVLRPNQTFTTTVSSGNTIPGSQEYQVALDGLNQLLDAFSTDASTIFQITGDTLALTGATTYTFGPGGSINTARPIKIRAATVLQTDGAMPAEIVSVEKFQSIIDRSATGSYIEMLFCDYASPAATLGVWPAPAAGTLVLDSYKALASVIYLSDSITLPPGYLETLKFNLAMALASEFPGAVLDQWVVQKAVEAKQRLAMLNAVTIGQPSAPLGRSPFQMPMREVDIEQGKPPMVNT